MIYMYSSSLNKIFTCFLCQSRMMIKILVVASLAVALVAGNPANRNECPNIHDIAVSFSLHNNWIDKCFFRFPLSILTYKAVSLIVFLRDKIVPVWMRLKIFSRMSLMWTWTLVLLPLCLTVLMISFSSWGWMETYYFKFDVN